MIPDGEPTFVSKQEGVNGRETSAGLAGDTPPEFPNPSHDLVTHVQFAALVNGFETLRSAVTLVTVIRLPEGHNTFLVWFPILTKMVIAGILLCSCYFSPEKIGGSHRLIRNMCFFGFLLHGLCPPIGVSPLLPDFGWYWYRWWLDFLCSYALPCTQAMVERQALTR